MNYLSQLHLKSMTRLVRLKEYEKKHHKHYYVYYYYPLPNIIRLKNQDGFGIMWHRLFLFRIIEWLLHSCHTVKMITKPCLITINFYNHSNQKLHLITCHCISGHGIGREGKKNYTQNQYLKDTAQMVKMVLM